jgi:hypothetical protein
MARGIIPRVTLPGVISVDNVTDGAFINEGLQEILTPGSLPPDYSAGQSKYNFNSRTFPSDLGTGFQGHFMVLNINVQTGTVMNKLNKNPSLSFEVLAGQNSNELSKTDSYRYAIDNTWTGKDLDNNTRPLGLELEGFGTRARFTRRIAESIALYMPNSELTFSDAHDFENISLTKFLGTGLSDITKGVAAFIGGVGGGLASTVGGILDATGKYGGSALQAAGSPINPKVEVLFANTFQREFAFDFLFSPSNENESKDLENIIRTIRFHASPEYKPMTNQFFWLPPSEFDISFYYVDQDGNIQENRKIPRINTCVLKQIDVSYAPSGAYSTFYDGHPVQIRMVLRFIETEVNSKLRIAQGF